MAEMSYILPFQDMSFLGHPPFQAPENIAMQRIGFVVFDGFQSMSVAALSVFAYANVMREKPLYEMHLLSEKGGLVRSSTGMVVDSKPFGSATYDTVIVGGGTTI